MVDLLRALLFVRQFYKYEFRKSTSTELFIGWWFRKEFRRKTYISNANGGLVYISTSVEIVGVCEWIHKKRQANHNDNNKNGLTKKCALLTHSLNFSLVLYYNTASFHVDCKYRFHSIFYFISHDQRCWRKKRKREKRWWLIKREIVSGYFWTGSNNKNMVVCLLEKKCSGILHIIYWYVKFIMYMSMLIFDLKTPDQ